MTHQVEHVTCLGCGCCCDDLTVTVRDDAIVDVVPRCPVGRAWFGDGKVPWQVVSDGNPVPFDRAISNAADLLSRARGRCLVYLGLDISSQVQRQALAIADLLGAMVDCGTSDTAALGLLAAQRRGRAGATLGEIRNRADVLLFWGVDPADRYPRYLSRYALEPVGTQVPQGRRGRFVISVSIGKETGPPSADLSLELEPEQEIAALSLMRASLQDNPIPELPVTLQQAVAIATRLKNARYAVLVHDAEATGAESLRAEALISLTQALNGPTRAALTSLRAGGNSVGAESVFTWQTGYPFAVDFARGYPRFVPGERALQRLARGAFRGALVVGAPVLNHPATELLGTIPSVTVGPRASQSPYRPRVAIDTGVAGIHEDGTAYRMDEVPFPLRPPLTTQRPAAETLHTLTQALRQRLASSAP